MDTIESLKAEPKTMSQREVYADAALCRDLEKMRENYHILAVAKVHSPEGASLVEAWDTGTQFVIIGTPNDCEDENSPEYHNCDAMGCGSCCHVVARVPKVDTERESLRSQLDDQARKIADLTRERDKLKDRVAVHELDADTVRFCQARTEVLEESNVEIRTERDTLKRQLETAREALSGLVKAEQRYVEESGMEIDDPITDAVKAAESALSTRTDKGEDAGNHSETPNSSNCREILGGSADAIHGEDAQKGGE